MARRLSPAVAICATASQQLHDPAERVAQVSGLLSTRVDVMRERQNQAMLASMDRRAKLLLRLRLQRTGEGLSLAAIVYHVAGLVGYLVKAGTAGGLPIQAELVVELSIPFVAILVMLALWRARRRPRETDAESPTLGQ